MKIDTPYVTHLTFHTQGCYCITHSDEDSSSCDVEAEARHTSRSNRNDVMRSNAFARTRLRIAMLLALCVVVEKIVHFVCTLHFAVHIQYTQKTYYHCSQVKLVAKRSRFLPPPKPNG
jgi:hypothetical protein